MAFGVLLSTQIAPSSILQAYTGIGATAGTPIGSPVRRSKRELWAGQISVSSSCR